MMDFFNESDPRARKAHKCEACGGIINPGERYRRQSGKWEGDFFSRAWCADCARIMDYYFAELTAENEFDYWDVQDSVAARFCSGCPHSSGGNDDCSESGEIWHCPIIHDKIKEAYPA